MKPLLSILAPAGGFRLTAILVAAVLWPGAGALADNEFKQGEHYHVISSPKTIGDSERIEIADVFWYGCPHCYTFLPILERWYSDNSDRVEVVRLPAMLNRGWHTHAQAYYVADSLGKADELHEAIFHRIHQDGQPLNRRQDLRAFFERYGVAPEEFDRAWESFAVDARMRRARQLNADYGIRGTPAVIINGRYMTAPNMVGTYDNALRLIDHLVTREEQRLAGE